MQVQLGEEPTDFLGAPLERRQQAALEALAHPTDPRSVWTACRANASSVSQVGLDAATDSVLFFVTGGVSFCSGVGSARGS